MAKRNPHRIEDPETGIFLCGFGGARLDDPRESFCLYWGERKIPLMSIKHRVWFQNGEEVRKPALLTLDEEWGENDGLYHEIVALGDCKQSLPPGHNSEYTFSSKEEWYEALGYAKAALQVRGGGSYRFDDGFLPTTVSPNIIDAIERRFG